jgi:rare lipoprotein A
MKISAATFSSPVGRLLLAAVCAVIVGSCATGSVSRVGHVTASWYGPKFHGRLTASGERFDMNALTCAHKRLSFGTVLRVTYVKTGRSVRVVVNDRGPFVRGRDLDLSRAAARHIGLDADGVGKVLVEVLGRDGRYGSYVAGARIQVPVSVQSQRGPFTVQVGAFRDRANAVHMRDGLDLNHDNVYLMEKWVDGIRFYRVRVGKFSSVDKAERYAHALLEEGYDADIVTYEKL